MTPPAGGSWSVSKVRSELMVRCSPGTGTEVGILEKMRPLFGTEGMFVSFFFCGLTYCYSSFRFGMLFYTDPGMSASRLFGVYPVPR